MVFKRRDKPPLLLRVREAVLPQRGWRQGDRVPRPPGPAPARHARTASPSASRSASSPPSRPFFGAHLLLAAGLAKLLRANIVASLIGTFVGNPLTFPFIAAVSLGLGRRILGYGASGHDFERLTDAFALAASGLWSSLMSLVGRGEPQWGRLEPFVDYVLWPYFVGGLLPGLAAAAASYWLLRPLIAAYQARRREKMLARAHDRLAAENSPADAARSAAYNDGTSPADARPDP